MDPQEEEKLLKKIAQLTKVIVLLNGKQEEHETELHRQHEAHEDEISVLLEDARRRLQAQEMLVLEERQSKEQLAEASNTAMRDLQARHAQELASLRQQMDTREKSIVEASGLEIERCMATLHMLQETSNARIHELQQALASRDESTTGQQKDHEGSLARMAAAHAAELATARTATAEWERQVALQVETNAILQKTIDSLKTDHAAAITSMESAHLAALAAAAREHSNEKENLVALQASRERVLVAENDDLRHRVSLSSANRDEQLSSLHADSTTLRAQLASAQGDLTEQKRLTAAAESSVVTLTAQIAGLQQQIAVQQKSISDLDSYSKQAEHSLEGSAAEVARLNAQLAALAAEKKRLSSAAGSRDEANIALTKAHEQAEARWREECEAIVASTKKEIDDTRRQQQSLVVELKAKLEQDRVGLLRMADDERAKMEAEHQIACDRAYKAQQELRAQLGRVGAELDHARATITARDETIATLQAHQAAAKAEADEKLASVTSELASATGELGRVSDQCTHLQVALGQAQAAAAVHEKELAAQLAERDAAHEAATAAMRAAVDNERAARMAALSSASREEQVERQRTEEYARGRGRLQAELADAQARVAALSSTMKSMQAAHTAERESQEALHVVQLERMHDEHAISTTALKAKLQQDFEQATERVQSEHAAQLAKITEEHSVAIRALKEEHRLQMEESTSQHLATMHSLMRTSQSAEMTVEEISRQAAAARALLSAEADRKLKETVDLYEHRLNDLNNRIAIEHVAETARRQRDEEKLAAANRELDSVRALHSTDSEKQSLAIAELRARIAALDEESVKTLKIVQQREQSLAAAEHAHADELAHAEARLAAAQTRRIEDISAAVLEERARAQDEVDHAAQLAAEKIAIYEEELAGAMTRFKARGPRECDLQRIAELEQHVHDAEKRINGMAAENARLLLEVQHREQSFQMVFKRTPAVGKLNPLGPSSRPAPHPSLATTHTATTLLSSTTTTANALHATGPARSHPAAPASAPNSASGSSSHAAANGDSPSRTSSASSAAGGRRLAPIAPPTHHALSSTLASQLASTLPSALPAGLRRAMPREESGSVAVASPRPEMPRVASDGHDSA